MVAPLRYATPYTLILSTLYGCSAASKIEPHSISRAPNVLRLISQKPPLPCPIQVHSDDMIVLLKHARASLHGGAYTRRSRGRAHADALPSSYAHLFSLAPPSCHASAFSAPHAMRLRLLTTLFHGLQRLHLRSYPIPATQSTNKRRAPCCHNDVKMISRCLEPKDS